MGQLTVIKQGFQTTIQDLGRFGYRKLGVPISGAMDSKSMIDANHIVGNPDTNPVIEHTFYGGKYKFFDSTCISITGASCNPTVNGELVPQYESVQVKSGDELEINYPTRGCRAYLAIQGKFSIPNVMESYSTYLQGKFGGFDGRTLQKGDVVNWQNDKNELEKVAFSKSQIPYFSTKITIWIEKGPEFLELSESAIKQLTMEPFEVDSKSNRMGIRLKSKNLKSPIIEMVSSPVFPGIIQLPPSGNPIILMKDGQTIGGYPRIGFIKHDDLWRLGQVKAGDQISFKFS